MLPCFEIGTLYSRLPPSPNRPLGGNDFVPELTVGPTVSELWVQAVLDKENKKKKKYRAPNAFMMFSFTLFTKLQWDHENAQPLLVCLALAQNPNND